MTLATTDTFDLSREQICAESLENVGAIGPGAVRDANNGILFDMAAIVLNRLVKSIDKTGMRLWRIVRRTVTTNGTDNFVLGSDVLDVDGPMRYTIAGQTSSTPVVPFSRHEYMLLPDRTQTGQTRNYYFEATLSTKTVFLWPVANPGDSIEYSAALRGKDLTDGAQTTDFPSKWITCLVHGLSAELCPKFRQTDKADGFWMRHKQELAELIGDDTERGPMIIAPFGGFYSGGGAG